MNNISFADNREYALIKGDNRQVTLEVRDGDNYVYIPIADLNVYDDEISITINLPSSTKFKTNN